MRTPRRSTPSRLLQPHASRTPRPALLPDAHAAGRRALRRGAWDEARSQLQFALATHETPEVLEDLALAAWWLDDKQTVFDARERAYALFRQGDDARGAARVAIWLVWDNLAFRGDFAVASGWLERARRLLADHLDAPEYGWLLLREGEVALFRGHDPAAAIVHAGNAATLGRRIGDGSVEFTGLALEGLARVSSGDVAGGMRCLDEATVAATSGEVTELHAVSVVCCWQIFACERVRDYDRASQWCARVQEFSRRWGTRTLSAVCRTQYAGVLIWRGDWAHAEEELATSARELEMVRPAMLAPALVRLGELRLRQGQMTAAEELFARCGAMPQARIGIAAVMLERGKAGESAALLEQVLLQVGEGEATLRAGALELLVRAHAALGDVDRAAASLRELEDIAGLVRTDPMEASAAAARAVVARGRGDLASAATYLEQSVALFERSGAPFETARTRGELAIVYRALARGESADREARLAAAAMDSLRAPTEKPRRGGSLTARQLEILRFIAQGQSNSGIATRLDLSEHTVKRHVANLLMRLDLPSRAAAAAYATREGLI